MNLLLKIAIAFGALYAAGRYLRTKPGHPSSLFAGVSNTLVAGTDEAIPLADTIAAGVPEDGGDFTFDPASITHLFNNSGFFTGAGTIKGGRALEFGGDFPIDVYRKPDSGIEGIYPAVGTGTTIDLTRPARPSRG